MPARPETTRSTAIVRSPSWQGVREGDAVVVNTPKERRRRWVFVAHVRNLASGEEWVEVRGGRVGEMKGRSFRPELIFPASARRGSRVLGAPLADAPQLPL